MTWKQWEAAIVGVSERFLSWRKRRRIVKKAKQKKRNPVVDWIDAILSAVVIVLLINQYLLQAYQIPSPSMVPTLLNSDRIFVNKLVYGPELAPGVVKIPGFRSPSHGDIIIFESPEYLPKATFLGPVLTDILQRVVYMVTFSLVDIDRDSNGNPKHHFLIKRAIGIGGDRLRVRDGDVELRTPGETGWKSEAVFQKELGLAYPVARTIPAEDYIHFRNFSIEATRTRAGLPADPLLSKDTEYVNSGYLKAGKPYDEFYVNMWNAGTTWAMDPSDQNDRADWTMRQNGWLIASDSIFPMGDNRDDSRDARYFGQVRVGKVLGRALFRYWPIGRFGGVR
jgi:signal peptidase I